VKSFPRTTLARNFGWTFVGQSLGYGLRIVYFILIARLLGVLQYGIVVGAFALVNLVAEYGRLGTGTILLRYVAPNRQNFATYWANLLFVTLTMGGSLIVVLRLIAPRVLDPGSAGVVVLTAISCCLLEQLTIGSAQAFQAFERMRVAAILSQLTSLLRTVAAAGMLLTMHRATAPQWAMALMTVSGTGAIIALTTVTLRLGWPRLALRLVFQHTTEGLEYAFSSTTNSAYNDLDKTMLSHYGMTAANGIYGLAYRIVDMATVPIVSIQLSAEPRLFQLADPSPDRAIALARRLLKHGLLVSAVAAAGMFILAPIIPFLAGKGFTEASAALRWLCLIPLFRSVHKIMGSGLTCIGAQRYRSLAQLIAALSNFGLNLWLIPRYGWHGAAWASLGTDGGLGILNWAALHWIQRRIATAGAAMPKFMPIPRLGRERAI
jgi:O-antigen/teichoic acid export membrane protein